MLFDHRKRLRMIEKSACARDGERVSSSMGTPRSSLLTVVIVVEASEDNQEKRLRTRRETVRFFDRLWTDLNNECSKQQQQMTGILHVYTHYDVPLRVFADRAPF